MHGMMKLLHLVPVVVVAVFCGGARATAAAPQFPVGRDAAEIYRREQKQREQQRNGYGDTSKAAVQEDPVLDCGMRRLFLEKAQAVLSWRPDNQDIRDALELKDRCNASKLEEDHEGQVEAEEVQVQNLVQPDATSTARYLKQGKKNKAAPPFVVYVCPNTGRDDDDDLSGHSGNETHPFLTLHRALQATREYTLKHGDDPKEIVMKPGIHFLKKPIILKPKDSNLIIRSQEDTTGSNTDSNRAWLSGGTLIDSRSAKWFPMITHPHIWIAHNLTTLQHDITGLFTVHPHQRMTLARYPNANVEEWDAFKRYDTIDKDKDEWIFPPFAGVPDFSSFVDLTDPNNPSGHTKDDSNMGPYNQYGAGQGGACSTVWGDLPSYWCSNVSAGGWAPVDQAAAKAGRLNLPAGLTLQSNSKFQQRVQQLWKHNPQGAIFQVAHSQGWAWHMFSVSSIENNATTTTIHFDKGGWQGGRNWECWDSKNRMGDCDGDDKKLHSGPWYVEGILEELDAPGEFYWDVHDKKLYFYPNCTTTAGANNDDDDGPCLPPDLIATNLKTLIQIHGTQDDPIRNIQLRGLGFRDAAKTYMEGPWAAPSGGDWSLYRGGAVHLEGTENVTISDCQFQRLDGNAIMLGGYNRYAHIARSEFNWLGEGAMATWGDTDPAKGYDATGGAQPRFSLIENNVMANLGLYEKQSSAWGQNKACQNTIRNNVMFNLPRAAINFNDGLGGGNLVEGNVIFNTCRESGDHGPINSWDRMPFLTEISGSPSFVPLPTHTQHNIIFANYGASQGFDNDDGSSWYYTHDNVFYQSDGFKMDYGGHSSKYTNNLAYSDNGKTCYGTGSFKEGQADVLENNTCIVVRDANEPAPMLGMLFQCASYGMIPASNRYYTVTGNGTFACGGDMHPQSLSEMQEKGHEVGSTIEVLPQADKILSWARDILAPGFRSLE